MKSLLLIITLLIGFESVHAQNISQVGFDPESNRLYFSFDQPYITIGSGTITIDVINNGLWENPIVITNWNTYAVGNGVTMHIDFAAINDNRILNIIGHGVELHGNFPSGIVQSAATQSEPDNRKIYLTDGGPYVERASYSEYNNEIQIWFTHLFDASTAFSGEIRLSNDSFQKSYLLENIAVTQSPGQPVLNIVLPEELNSAGLDPYNWIIALDPNVVFFTDNDGNIEGNYQLSTMSELRMEYFDHSYHFNSSYVNDDIGGDPYLYVEMSEQAMYSGAGVVVTALNSLGVTIESIPLDLSENSPPVNSFDFSPSIFLNTTQYSKIESWLNLGYYIQVNAAEGAYYEYNSNNLPAFSIPFSNTSGWYIEGYDTLYVQQGPTFYSILNKYDESSQMEYQVTSKDESILPSNGISVKPVDNGFIIEVLHYMKSGTVLDIDILATDVTTGQFSRKLVTVKKESEEVHFLDIVQSRFVESEGISQLVVDLTAPVFVSNATQIVIEALESPFEHESLEEFRLNTSENPIEGDGTQHFKIGLSDTHILQIKRWYSEGHFVKIVFEEGALSPKFSEIDIGGYTFREIGEGMKNPDAIEFDYYQQFTIGLDIEDKISFWVHNPRGPYEDVVITEIVSRDPGIVTAYYSGLNNNGEQEINVTGMSQGSTVLTLTFNNGFAISEEKLYINVTEDVVYNNGIRTEVPMNYSIWPNSYHSVTLWAEATPNRENSYFYITGYSTNSDVVELMDYNTESYSDFWLNFESHNSGNAQLVLTITDELGNTTERIIEVIVEDNGDPGMGGMGDCYGPCLNDVTLIYDEGVNALSLRWNDFVNIAYDSEIVLMSQNNKEGVSEEQEISIPININNVTRMGTDMELSISETLKNTILDQYRSSHNMRAVIPGGVFYTNDNVYYEPDSREIWFHLEQGNNFEIFASWYQPIEGKVTIEFDGEIKMDQLYAMSGTLRVGTSNTNNVIIPFANPSTEHAHWCGTEPSGYEQECTTTIDIYISPEQKKSITELGDQNNLLIAMNDGAFYSRYGNPLVNAQFDNKIRIYFGTDGGENWVQSATLSPNDGRIVLNMDREISSLYDITLDESNFSGTQLFMVMVVDVKGVDNQYNNDSEGGDLPPDSDPRVLYISRAQNGVQLLGNQIIITLNQENRTKVQNWRGDYRYALDYGDIGFMVGPETMTSTAGEVGGGFENSIEVLPFDDVEGSDVEGSSVPAPQVKVVTNEGLSYFECSGDTTWIVTVYPNAIRNDCIVGQRVYLEKGATYRVVAQDSEGTPSDAVTQSSLGRPVPDIRIDTTGTALLIGFVSENVDDIENATFSYSIRVGDSVVVGDTAYTSWGHQFFGDNGQTYIIEAKMESLEKGELGFINQFSITDTITLIAPSTLSVKANEWNMLSFGGTPFQVSQLTDSETLFKWDDNKIEDLLFSKYLSKDELDNIEPGEACWYHSEMDTEIELKYTTETISTVLSHGDEGWNQVANPYSFNLSTNAFGENMEFFKWNGSQYYKVNYLKPGEGYLTYVTSDERITIGKVVAWKTDELYSLQTYKKAMTNEQDWEITVTLTSDDGTLQDQYNVIGVKPMASNGFDELDKYELPGTMDDAVIFSVLEGDKILRTNFKEPIEDIGLWKVSVGTTSENTSNGTLSFEGVDAIRSLGYSLFLTDGAVQTEIVGTSIPVSLTENKEYGIVVARSGVSLSSQAVGAGVFNYPNPVRGYTQIRLRGVYSMDDKATLRVFDVKGSVVYTGVYNTDSDIIWHAESNSGTPLEHGMYYYELQIGGTSYSNVMMVAE